MLVLDGTRLRVSSVWISLVLVIAGSTDAQPAGRDFSGTWTLNVSKSDYGPFPAPARRTDVVEQGRTTLKVMRREATVNGAERSGQWQCSTDGAECTNRLGGTELRSTVHWEESTLVVETKTTYEGQPAFLTDRWTLSTDHRTLTVSRHGMSPQGTADQTFVFERQ